MTGMSRRTGHVGRIGKGHLWLEIELRARSGEFETIEHEIITSYTELSICASGFYGPQRRGRRDIDFGGQAVDEALNVTRPSEGWTKAELRQVHEVWLRWHLNGARAACAHQSVVNEPDGYGRERGSLTKTPPCPLERPEDADEDWEPYRYGHKWLVEPLPADIEVQVREWARRLDGTAPLED